MTELSLALHLAIHKTSALDTKTHKSLEFAKMQLDRGAIGLTVAKVGEAEVVGNCGFSAYPPARNPVDLWSFANGIFCGDDQ